MRSLPFVLLLVSAHPMPAEPPKEMTDLEKLQGEWVLVGLEVREESVPAEKLAGTTLVIKKNTYTTVVKKKEYPAFVAAQVTTDKLFRVQLGPFADVKEAEAMRTRLIGDGYSPILKK